MEGVELLLEGAHVADEAGDRGLGDGGVDVVGFDAGASLGFSSFLLPLPG